MLIRRLTEDDLEALWMLRLRALTDNPESFGSTYKETIAQGNTWMLQRLRQEGEGTFYLGAFEESLIGMVRFLREEGAKDRHKGSVTSLYVLPQGRGQGIGKVLMQELIARAKRLAGLEQLHLAVVTTAVVACNLYRSLGFETYGTAPRFLKMGEQYWDEDLMVLHLR
jgi:ribosomal protein S18 acetylase RimI-like enzyme